MKLPTKYRPRIQQRARRHHKLLRVAVVTLPELGSQGVHILEYNAESASAINNLGA